MQFMDTCIAYWSELDRVVWFNLDLDTWQGTPAERVRDSLFVEITGEETSCV